METMLKNEWQEQRQKALYAHLKRQNLKWKQAYLVDVQGQAKQAQLRYLKSKLNCCGLWYGTYHEGQPHPSKGVSNE